MSTSSPLLEVQNLSVRLSGRDVLRSISLTVAEGEFFALLGPSGCGKTTLLRAIAGFQQPTSGDMLWCGESITHCPPQKRDLNLVFQNYALFPHMNVFDNVAFGLRMQKHRENEVRSRVMEVLEQVRMEAFAQRRIGELSGGQQQRIALARAIAPRPKLVLLDEPLGALDLQLRRQMQIELKLLQRQLGMTFIYVTHDQDEAFTMADRIALLNEGCLEQVDIPTTLYHQPASHFVAQFVGTANILPAQLSDGIVSLCDSAGTPILQPPQLHGIIPPAHHSRQQADSISLSTKRTERRPSSAGDVVLRPEQLTLSASARISAEGLAGTITLAHSLGAFMRYQVTLRDKHLPPMTVDIPSTFLSPFRTGDAVTVHIQAAEVPFFPRNNPV
jgi:spermidine/putrescine transport system ATP-binding protein